MKKLLLSAFTLTSCIVASSQDNEKTSAIVAEGKMLYRSEMASWYGTDIFLEKFKNLTEKAGGYFSYIDEDVTKCIFFSTDEKPKVLVTISFDRTYAVATAKTDSKERDLSKHETDIYTIRKKALEIINSDTLFKTYKNTNLNLIPLVNGNDKKVYILTGTTQNDVVIIGNDYLLTFDKDNNLVTKKQLHKNIIPINYGQKDQDVFATVHTHLPETGEYITPTDVCTLMLYGKFTKWKQHIVISENYISIWNFETNELITLTKEAWDKINKDQKEKGN